jgi:hypothetical protein
MFANTNHYGVPIADHSRVLCQIGHPIAITSDAPSLYSTEVSVQDVVAAAHREHELTRVEVYMLLPMPLTHRLSIFSDAGCI